MLALDFLETFDLPHLDWVLRHAKPKTVLADGLLIKEGDPPSAIHFITDGVFDVLLGRELGNPVRIGRRGRGEMIGEISWLDRKPASATVVAAESSAVLALPIDVLDLFLAENLRFAAQFHRAVALVTAARMRELLAHARQAQPALQPSAQAGGPEAAVFSQVAEFKALLVAADKRALQNRNEFSPEDEAGIRTRFNGLVEGLNALIGEGTRLSPAVCESIGGAAQRELLPLVQLAKTTERFYSKPRGYAGDFATIEMIYDGRAAGTGRIGPLLDACFLERPSGRAVVNRRKLLAAEINATLAAARTRPVRIMSLACGPAREVFDVFATLDDKQSLQVTAVDIDHEALKLVSGRSRGEGLEERIDARHGNLVYLATGREVFDLPPQDLVYSIGLIDYFNDSFVVALINWIHDRLAPGGRVILGNFHKRNPDKAMMDHVLEWKLIHRDEADMDRLFQSSKFGRKCTRVLFEPEKINLFAECVRA